MTGEDVDRAIELIVNDVEPDGQVGRAIVEATDEFVDAANALSVRVARRFVGGSLGYEAADTVMNWLWVHVTDWLLAADGREMPEPTYSIFDAMDAGEYHRPDDPPDVDPVLRYTMPAIVSIVRSLPPSAERA